MREFKMKLTKSDIALIDELIEQNKNCIDKQSKFIFEQAVAFKNNQTSNQSLLKEAIKKLRAEKKIKKYDEAIAKKLVFNKNAEAKKLSRQKFLTGHAIQKIFDEHKSSLMLKMIVYDQLSNEKDKEFLLSNVEVIHFGDTTTYTITETIENIDQFMYILRKTEFSLNDESIDESYSKTEYNFEYYLDNHLLESVTFSLSSTVHV